MDILFASWFVRLILLYLGLGLLFSVYFVGWGVNKIDPNAAQGSWGFRLLIIPGSIALWPLLLSRLVRGQTEPPSETNAHRQAGSL